MTWVLIPKPPVASAFTGSEMLSGIWIGSVVVQPIGSVKNPTPTEPTTMFAAPVALWLKTPEFESPTVPVIVPTGLSAPLIVTGKPSIVTVWWIGGMWRLAVSLPVVTSPSALSVAPLGTSSAMPDFASVDGALQLPRRAAGRSGRPSPA